MAHYAKIENGIVTEVIVAEQSYIDTIDGQWVQTSYNTLGNEHKLGGQPLRKNFAGIDYTYDAQRDAFIPPKPYASWALNDDTCLWESPVPYPDDGESYIWNEENLSWNPTK
jgi:hypothetical protein